MSRRRPHAERAIAVLLDRPGVPGQIHAYGFRNPFRFSFDEKGGTLLLADVGQHDIEETDVITSGGSYGWRHKGGSFFFDPHGMRGWPSSAVFVYRGARLLPTGGGPK